MREIASPRDVEDSAPTTAQQPVCSLIQAPSYLRVQTAPLSKWRTSTDSNNQLARHEIPAARAVASAHARSRPEPECEAALPRRSFAAAITGAASGIERTASWAFKP